MTEQEHKVDQVGRVEPILTWKLIAKTLFGISFALVCWFLKDANSQIENLKSLKVDKEIYYRDESKRDQDIKEIKEGIKSIINMHLKDKE